MKKLLLAILVFLFTTSAYSATWCRWSGTEGTNCQAITRHYIVAPDGRFIAVDASSLGENGFYELVVTEPVLGVNQIKDQIVWGFTGSQITKTWSVRSLTTTEIDTDAAVPMPLSEYYLWKTLIVTGVITQQQASNNLPQELIDAYQARDRLENT